MLHYLKFCLSIDQIEMVGSIDSRYNEPGSNVESNAYPPQVPLRTHPRNSAYRGNYIINLHKKLNRTTDINNNNIYRPYSESRECHRTGRRKP